MVKISLGWGEMLLLGPDPYRPSLLSDEPCSSEDLIIKVRFLEVDFDLGGFGIVFDLPIILLTCLFIC